MKSLVGADMVGRLCLSGLQACQWQVSGLKGNFNVTLNVDEQPSARQLVFTLQESSFMNDFEGRWQVGRQPEPGGSSTDKIGSDIVL